MLSVRPPSIDDKTEFIAAMKQSENFHRPWVEPPKDEAAFEAFVKKYEADDHISYFVIYDDKIAGVINMNAIIRGIFQSAFLGYYVVKEFSNRGIMHQGLHQVLTLAFNQHHLHRLEANIQPDNIASINLVKRCGFQKEGFSKNYLKILEQWRDHERWAITKEIFDTNSHHRS